MTGRVTGLLVCPNYGADCDASGYSGRFTWQSLERTIPDPLLNIWLLLNNVLFPIYILSCYFVPKYR